MSESELRTSDNLPCLLCGQAQSYPGYAYRNHLVYDHGVLFGAQFLVDTSVYKNKNLKVPTFKNPQTDFGKKSVVDVFSQTAVNSKIPLCKCESFTKKYSKKSKKRKHANSKSDPKTGAIDETTIKKEVDPLDISTESIVDCWLCPLCPMVYKRRYHFNHHITNAHQLLPDEVSEAWKSSLTEVEFLERQSQAQSSKSDDGDETSKKKSSWGDKAFSTLFQCIFCKEEFKKDSNLVVHLKIEHQDEPKEMQLKALKQVSESKLDGCVYQCKICDHKYSAPNSFARHIKDMHFLEFKQYVATYGSSEVVSGTFTCRICSRSMKQTRNVISQHMKYVHQISWQVYQNMSIDSILKGDEKIQEEMPIVINFECALCNSKVKLRKQHLDKIHHIDEDVYETFLNHSKENTTLDKVMTCKMCNKMCMDLDKHLKSSHKSISSIEDYEKQVDIVIKDADSTHKSLKCPFGCIESFKKEISVLIHFKLKHFDKNEDEMEKAKKSVAEQEAKITRTFCSILCKICESNFSGRSSFWTHLKRKHQINIQEYEIKYGKLEINNKTFLCKICLKVLGNERSAINAHLKYVHHMDWEEYLQREESDKSDDSINSPDNSEICLICNNKFKRIKNHIKLVHSMSMMEYEDALVKMKDYDRSISTDKEICNIEDVTKISIKEDAENEMPYKEEGSKIDVTNKYLKSCHKCNEDFQTRRIFLEHCQVVHEMKFKLKNGQYLPGPSMKREPPNTRLSDCKRIKIEFD